MTQFPDLLRQGLFDRAKLAVWLVVTVLAGLVGPFGSYGYMTFPLRVLFWGIQIGGAIVLVVAFRALLLTWRPKIEFSMQVLIEAVVSGALVTGYVTLIAWAWPWFGAGAPGVPQTIVFASASLSIIAVHLSRALLHRSVTEEIVNGASDEPETDLPEPVRLTRRLPERVGTEILHVSSQDHHVIVRTTLGEATIRMRLTDAVDELEGLEGLCTHRSHWVASSAVAGYEMNGRRPVLILTDETRVPVSKKYEPDVVAAGLLPEL